ATDQEQHDRRRRGEHRGRAEIDLEGGAARQYLRLRGLPCRWARRLARGHRCRSRGRRRWPLGLALLELERRRAHADVGVARRRLVALALGEDRFPEGALEPPG